MHSSNTAQERALSCIRVKVLMLDESSKVFELEKCAKGQALLDLVYNHLDLVERDYFGLQYMDNGLMGDKIWRWLDPLKSVKKQLRLRTKALGSLGTSVIHFRVKFWATDPGRLAEEYTRYLMVLQIKRDLLQGRIGIPQSTEALLASFALQAEFGDYNTEEHGTHYLSNLNLIPNRSHDFEFKVIEMHKLHKGQSPSDAEFNYLDHAKRLDLYGVDTHLAKDSSGRELTLGVTSSGLCVFKNGVRINAFSWAKITKVSFKRKQFFIQLRRELTESYDSVLIFNLGSYTACKALWKSCVEHHTFFRLHAPKIPVRKAVLCLGSKFRYSGRTEYQTVEDCKRRPFHEKSFVRSPSKIFSSSLSAPSLAGLRPLPLISNQRQRSDSLSNYKVTSLISGKTPKRAWGDEDDNSDEITSELIDKKSEDMEPSSANNGYQFSSTMSLEKRSSLSVPLSELGKNFPHTDDKEKSANFPQDDSSLSVASIIIRCDSITGKFGFNVKGGNDQNQPLLVSRVASGTPADRCYPRLNEGDQVLFINNRDVSEMNHEEVVTLIRTSREAPLGELRLTVKQNVYEPEGLDEPSFQYVPETIPEGSINPVGGMAESLLLLSEGLEAGSLVAQFDQCYRRKPGMDMLESRKPENEKKNRYRDISPYDATRVILQSSSNGDYINGSHVEMQIPNTTIVNHYIACQGPLSSTAEDFWRMIWEQGSKLIVMLTTVVEQGRIKCYRYWPQHCDFVEFGSLKIMCLKEEETPGFAYREFIITNSDHKESRSVNHMQYLAWPDHGVPDDSMEFLKFISRVRQSRTGVSTPTIVHCSAGIGRTGVLILMETTQCLIEANQPVYPLDIVRKMRDQRAMMIQTASQYRFVCEAICRVYMEGLVRPLSVNNTR